MAIHVFDIVPFSDGDETRTPSGSAYARADNDSSDKFKERIGQLWAKHLSEKGADNFTLAAGTKYTIDRFPDGYILWEKPRMNNSKHIDRYTYGHQKGAFDSANKFFDHFKWLMSHGQTGQTNEICQCVLCGKDQMAPRRQPASKVTMLHSQAPLIVFERVLEKLEKDGTIDTALDDESNQVLITYRDSIKQEESTVKKSPAYLPRIGEIVLYNDSDLDAPAPLNPETGKYALGLPIENWKAGVVTLLPDPAYTDIRSEDNWGPKKVKYNLNYTGFKIEFLRKVAKDGSSLRDTGFTYVELCQIRPFSLYGEVLEGLPHREWDVSIDSALGLMKSVSIVDPFHMKGNWPNANTFCRAIWIGAEIVHRGDAVRLFNPSEPQSPIHTVLFVEDIIVEGRNYGSDAFSYQIILRGQAYTTDINNTTDGFHPVKVDKTTALEKLPPAMAGWTWYYVPTPGESRRFALNFVIGRLHEYSVYAAWGDESEIPDFNIGMQTVANARSYSASNYVWTGQNPTNDLGFWYWADNRSMQLEIYETSGQDGTGAFELPTQNVMAILSGRSLDNDEGSSDSDVDGIIKDMTAGKGLIVDDEDATAPTEALENGQDETSAPEAKRKRIMNGN